MTAMHAAVPDMELMPIFDLTHEECLKEKERAESKEMKEIMARLSSWDFNVLNVASHTKGKPLVQVAWRIMNQLDLMRKYNMDEKVVLSFLANIERGYRANNPFHNCIHATDVLHAMYIFMRTPRLRNIMKDHHVLAATISCIIHDYQHPGVSNKFMVASNHPLSELYQGKSVLENHHYNASLNLIDNGLNILSSLPAETEKQVRELMRSMVLATDMEKHFDFITRFKAFGERMKEDPSMSLSDDDVCLCLCFAIKCSDLCNPCKSFGMCEEWAKCVMEEFFRQGDIERENSSPISVPMDRSDTNIPKAQQGFISFVVIPMYELWSSFLEFPEPIEHLNKNLEQWKALEKANPGPAGNNTGYKERY